MYHSLLIYLPNEGHLGCFQVLATIDKVAVCRFFCGCKLSTPLDKYQVV